MSLFLFSTMCINLIYEKEKGEDPFEKAGET